MLLWVRRVISMFSKKEPEEVALPNNRIPSAKELRESIEDWNIEYPIDRWWRSKHKVPFGSEEHDSMSIVDMYLEFKEDEMYNELRDRQEYIPNKGDYLRDKGNGVEMSEEEKYRKFLDESTEIDLSNYDD